MRPIIWSRAREMYSAELIKEEVLEARRIVKERSPRLSRALEQVNKHLLALKRECEDFQILPDVSVLALGLMKALGRWINFWTITGSSRAGRRYWTSTFP